MTMVEKQPSALDMLARLVQAAEVKHKSGSQTAKVNNAAKAVQSAITAFHDAQEMFLTEIGPAHQALEECTAASAELETMTKQVAKLRGSLSKEEFQEAETQITTARTEIATKKAAANAVVLRITKARDTTGTDLDRALEEYDREKKVFEKLLPGELANLEECQIAERMIKGIQNKTVYGKFLRLADEVESIAEGYYAKLERSAQYHQLRIWIGTLRMIQEEAALPVNAAILSDAQKEDLIGFFRRLVGISKLYMPGHIAAFQEGWRPEDANWSEYIESARESLIQLSS
jgi:hypothetical protein